MFQEMQNDLPCYCMRYRMLYRMRYCIIVYDIVEAQALPRQCLQRGIKIINLHFRDADNKAGGAGEAGAWPQRQQAHKTTGENLSYTTSHTISW